MGQGWTFKCENCNKEVEFFLGIGFCTKMRTCAYVCFNCGEWELDEEERELALQKSIEDCREAEISERLCKKCNSQMRKYTGRGESPGFSSLKLTCKCCGKVMKRTKLFKWD